MAYELSPFASIPLDETLLKHLIATHREQRRPRLNRLWCYYRNALAEPNVSGGSSGPPDQAAGLPIRLRNSRRVDVDDRFAREVVVENDIGWRIHTLCDFMFPAPLRFVSQAADDQIARRVEAILHAIFRVNGDAQLWQQAALLGSIYGSVDFKLNSDDLGQLPATSRSEADLEDIANRITIELIEAPRAIALLDEDDYRRIEAFIIHCEQPTNEIEPPATGARIVRLFNRSATTASHRRLREVVEIHTATHRQRYEDGGLVDEQPNRLQRLPVVHVQNLAQPFVFDGLSDVEPLIPLQDELNTRLSDRANRVTMQSFRMWLGKGIEHFDQRPIGPGQMWTTDNTDASIEGFGGDAASPSEEAHIRELREAMDKASGVTPAAAGHIQARIGNLTSENALRISLMGTLAKIKRKRVTYGAGIAQLCELILHALHVHGVLRTDARDRTVEIVWPDPLPIDESRRIDDALKKAELGIEPAKLREELGYPDGGNAS